jgi:hypothetical protein
MHFERTDLLRRRLLRGEADETASLPDAFRVIRWADERNELVVAHPLRGRFVAACDALGGVAPAVGEPVDVTLSKRGELETISRMEN